MAEKDKSLTPMIDDDEIDLREIARVLWSGKWIIVGVVLVAMTLSSILALVQPNVYRAEALLAPNETSNASTLGTIAADYAGLASLAGLDLRSGSADRAEMGLATLRSRKFLTSFIRRHEALVPLMASVGWNRETGELVVDQDTYDSEAGEWVRDVSPPKTPRPSMQEASQRLLDILSVTKDRSSGFVTVAISHYSPVIAKQWVDWLVEDLNATIMRDDVAEAERAIEYLSEQIESTSLAQLQNVFFDLIEGQKKIMMLAAVSPEYLFKTIDPSVIPERKVGPNRVLIVAVGTLFGFLVGAAIAIVRPRRGSK